MDILPDAAVQDIFQSTLPREERQITCQLTEGDFIISIHAPTRGATSMLIDEEGLLKISIHAPTRGATYNLLSTALSVIISIHAPTRGATIIIRISDDYMNISIHAPTRGATAILHKKFVYFYTIPTINI